MVRATPPVSPTADRRAESPNDAIDNPHGLAIGYLNSFISPNSPLLLRFWRDEFHRYIGGTYQPIPDYDQRAELTTWVRSEFLRLNAASMGHEEKPPKVKPVTSKLIGDVLQALRGLCLLPASTDAPVWIDGVNGPDPAQLLIVRNGILDFGSLAEGHAECLLPLSPSFFTPTAAPFEFDPNAPDPVEWLRFLGEIWADDSESINSLQEWFGYLLTSDTRQQKMLFLLGPRRSGKGTIARVLRELIGPGNIVGPTLGSLATPFGLSPLLGRSVAIISDARLSGQTDSAVITERLLSISGEDAVSVDRKFRESLTVKLPVRFVIISNELPRVGDPSGALVGRLNILRLTQSWFGQEDTGLTERLLAELPGILLWAIEGWRRLRSRGRFLQPASAAELISDLEDLSSPVGAFVRECCYVEPGARIEVRELYQAWRSWCEQHGKTEPGTAETFGRDLRATVPTLSKTRPRTSEGRQNVYSGIRLRCNSDPEHDDHPAPEGVSGHSGHRDLLLHALSEGETGKARGSGETRTASPMSGHSDHCDRTDRPRRSRFANNDGSYDHRG